MVKVIHSAFDGGISTPPIIDTRYLNLGIPYDNYPFMFEPVFAMPSIFNRHAKFMGFEKINLRWMKPDGKGGLVPQ